MCPAAWSPDLRRACGRPIAPRVSGSLGSEDPEASGNRFNEAV